MDQRWKWTWTVYMRTIVEIQTFDRTKKNGTYMANLGKAIENKHVGNIWEAVFAWKSPGNTCQMQVFDVDKPDGNYHLRINFIWTSLPYFQMMGKTWRHQGKW